MTIKYDGDAIATGVLVVFELNATPKNFSVASGCSVIILHCSWSGCSYAEYQFFVYAYFHLSQCNECMRFATMWYVQPAKPQISLRIRAD